MEQHAPALPTATSIEGLLLAAVNSGATVDQLERLMNLRVQMRAEVAKEQFDRAMSSFQAQCPSIAKTKAVTDKQGRHRYNYAPLEAIVVQVKDLIGSSGLSYRLGAEVIKATQENPTSWVKATCVVIHELGHEEASYFEVPVDMEAYMSAPQKFASALTFAKRYAFCNAFGIMTADDDTDTAEQVDMDLPDEVEQEPLAGTGLYFLERVSFHDKGRGTFAMFHIHSHSGLEVCAVFDGWQHACADVQVNPKQAQVGISIKVGKLADVTLSRKGQYWNIEKIALHAADGQTAAPQADAPAAQQPTPAPAGQPEAQQPAVPPAEDLQPPVTAPVEQAARAKPPLTEVMQLDLARNIVYDQPIIVRVHSIKIETGSSMPVYARISLLFGDTGKWASMYEGWTLAVNALGFDPSTTPKGVEHKLEHAMAARVTLSQRTGPGAKPYAHIDAFELLGKISDADALQQAQAIAGAAAPAQQPSVDGLSEKVSAELLYHVRRESGKASWQEAELLLSTSAQERFGASPWRTLDSDTARKWIDRYKTLPNSSTFLNEAGTRTFTEADALRYIRGEYDPELGDLGEAVNMQDNPLNSGE